MALAWVLKTHCRPAETDDLHVRVGLAPLLGARPAADGAGICLQVRIIDILQPDELQQLESARHRPQFCLQMIANVVAMARIAAPMQSAMDQNMTKVGGPSKGRATPLPGSGFVLPSPDPPRGIEAMLGVIGCNKEGGLMVRAPASSSQLHDVVGECERILRTPIPLSYTRHTARFMVIWLALVPFVLFKTMGFWVRGRRGFRRHVQQELTARSLAPPHPRRLSRPFSS